MKSPNLFLSLAVLILTYVSAAAHADEKDLHLFKALVYAGLQTDNGMSKIYVGASQISCTNNSPEQSETCTLIDTNADTKNELTISQENGTRLAEAVEENIDMSDFPFNPSGTWGTYVEEIHCQQTAAGVAEGSEAERTICTIILSK